MLLDIIWNKSWSLIWIISAIKTVLATKTLGLLVLSFKDPGCRRVLSSGESQTGIQCLTQRRWNRKCYRDSAASSRMWPFDSENMFGVRCFCTAVIYLKSPHSLQEIRYCWGLTWQKKLNSEFQTMRLCVSKITFNPTTVELTERKYRLQALR